LSEIEQPESTRYRKGVAMRFRKRYESDAPKNELGDGVRTGRQHLLTRGKKSGAVVKKLVQKKDAFVECRREKVESGFCQGGRIRILMIEER